jgi:tetratricopeptide (TPR) repeat protein
LAAIEKAIEVAAKKPERFWLKKGELLETLKRLADARAAYAKARTLNPKLLVAWRKEMELAQAVGDSAAAEVAKAKYLELDPTGKK